MVAVPRLVCPLCGTVVADGTEPGPGECRGCGALYAGGGESPPAAVAAAMSSWRVEGLPPEDLARRLFELEPPASPAPAAAVTSDQRDDFYLWWVFVRPGEIGVGAALQGLLDR